jgi:hypothetical protein
LPKEGKNKSKGWIFKLDDEQFELTRERSLALAIPAVNGILIPDRSYEMSEKSWETVKIQYCQHIDKKVGLQAQVVYPPDIMPEQPPRILAHRCSHGAACNLDGRPSCVWAGTNPAYDPFKE